MSRRKDKAAGAAAREVIREKNDARERFRELLAERAALVARAALFMCRDNPVQRAFDATVVLEAMKVRAERRRKLTIEVAANTLRESGTYDAVLAPFEALYKEWSGAFYTMRDKLDAELRTLAADLDVKPGYALLEAHVARTYTYSSQPARVSYARREAEAQAEEFEAHGIETLTVPQTPTPGPVRELSHGSAWGYNPNDTHAFAVFVRVKEALDIEILRRKPARPLREQVRAVLKRGGNPFVHFPALQATGISIDELLSKLKLDWQGRDTAPEKVKG